MLALETTVLILTLSAVEAVKQGGRGGGGGDMCSNNNPFRSGLSRKATRQSAPGQNGERVVATNQAPMEMIIKMAMQ